MRCPARPSSAEPPSNSSAQQVQYMAHVRARDAHRTCDFISSPHLGLGADPSASQRTDSKANPLSTRRGLARHPFCGMRGSGAGP